MLLLKRKNSLRVKGFDYRYSCAYFVTVCTHQRKQILGCQNSAREIVLSPVGQIVDQCLKEIPVHFKDVELDSNQILPNHVHFILILKSAHASSVTRSGVSNADRGTLCRIVGSFKSACTNHVRKANLAFGPIWQRSFYDRIILREPELMAVRQYIADNPVAWDVGLDQ